MSENFHLPRLYVEGTNDISVINALLKRHGIDTERGNRYLKIEDLKEDDAVLASMPDAIRANTERPVGFVLDIDIEVANRWSAVCGRLREAGVIPPDKCPSDGYLDQLPDYRCKFGIWLMPDCSTDFQKLEHLCQTLVAAEDPLWPHSQASVAQATTLVDDANAKLAPGARRWSRFRDVDRIKAEMHTWLAWQRAPGEIRRCD